MKADVLAPLPRLVLSHLLPVQPLDLQASFRVKG